VFDYLTQKQQDFLEKLGVASEQDALFFLPRRYEDRTHYQNIDHALTPETCVTYGDVESVYYKKTAKGKAYINANVVSESGRGVSLQFFNPSKALFGVLKNANHLMVYGEIVYRKDTDKGFVMYNPEFDMYATPEKPGANFLKIVPVYALTKGLTQNMMRSVMSKVLGVAINTAKSYIFRRYVEKYNLPPLTDSLLYAHRPPQDAKLEVLNDKNSIWHKRLKYEELFLYSMCIEKTKQKYRTDLEPPVCKKIEWGQMTLAMYQSLKFRATETQIQAVRDAVEDMESGKQLRRLLHGDVGSGKTTVAAELALYIQASGGQTAFMAPTETLAEQHYETLTKSLHAVKTNVALLTGSVSAKDKREVRKAIKSGETHIVVGTHALFQKSVVFHDLMLVVIDEQHKFGAKQRTKLYEKGENVHLLQMSATPIPRSLTMSLFGDMDISTLERIPGRIPPTTKVCPTISIVYNDMHEYLAKGEQVYVVCPLIEESEKIDLRSATEMWEKLTQDFPGYTIELLHGRMSSEEKHDVMSRFAAGTTHVIVSTTVIEVGIDNPNANLIIIDHAERFGLSQLHQLRGRVGRSGKKCDCVLIASAKISDDAHKRLTIMTQTNDGFKIAEADLEIRGPGDFFGTDQSGFINSLHVADILKDIKAFEYARRDARTIICEFPDLQVHAVLAEKVEWMLEVNYV